MTIEAKEPIISENLRKKVDIISRSARVKYELIKGCAFNMNKNNYKMDDFERGI